MSERRPSRYSVIIPTDSLVLMLVVTFLVGLIVGIAVTRLVS